MKKELKRFSFFLLSFYVCCGINACERVLLASGLHAKRVSFVDIPTVYIQDQEQEAEERILGMFPSIFAKNRDKEIQKSLWKRISDRERIAIINDQSGMKVPDVLAYFGVSSDFISFSYDDVGGVFETQKHFYIVNSEYSFMPPSIQWKVLCRKKAEWPFCIFSSPVIVRRYNNRLFYIPQD